MFSPDPPRTATSRERMDRMDVATVHTLLSDLAAQRWGDSEVRREPMRAWQMSSVERIHHGTGPATETVIFKYARTPFTSEARVLEHVARHGVPTPHLLAVAHLPGMLGMLLEDLGPIHREPTLAEAGAAAAATHAITSLQGLDMLDAAGLAELPEKSLISLSDLTGTGRWTGVDDITDGLRTLLASAPDRADGAQLPPFGLCHSEFHPTSLHVTANGNWRLLDWARAFVGPGLLDLISWQGTTAAPDTAAFRALLDAYIAAGGSSNVLADRGGLPVDQWSILWHRAWIIEWYLSQATTWISDPATDTTYQRVI
ncbi:MAG: aminoglycoside phosphotransferase, partial [Streptosporangiaceae bacterium]|nr:aminoglycoside phosphotransferase [Streptosporangiaceae bacterium]